MTTPRVLVAGVGNIFFGDDGFGVEVARRLAQAELPDSVRVVDFGIRSYDLAFAIVDCPELTIFVDATSRGGAPGTIYTIEIDPVDFTGITASVDPHRLDLVQVLRMAGGMADRLGRMLLVGCEPATFGAEDEGCMGLSPEVEEAVGRAVSVVKSLIPVATAV